MGACLTLPSARGQLDSSWCTKMTFSSTACDDQVCGGVEQRDIQEQPDHNNMNATTWLLCLRSWQCQVGSWHCQACGKKQ
jgi:hypothetical protein